MASFSVSTFKTVLASIALATSTSCGEPRSEVEHGELAYPTFELFTSSRSFGFLTRDADRVSLSQISGLAGAIDEQMRSTTSAMDRLYTSAWEESALLEPRVPYQDLSTYRIMPLIFLRLAPLWDEPSWSIVDVTEAHQAAALLRQLVDGPEARFVQGDDAGNQRNLEALVRWFHGLQSRPECIAAMLFTLDTGPFAGIPLASEPLFETEAVQELDDDLELRLAELVGEPEPWALQCVRDDRVAWTSVLSAQPAGKVSSAEFADMDPIDLGPWGWLVVVRVRWSSAEQHAYVYVDEQGKLRFYYLSA